MSTMRIAAADEKGLVRIGGTVQPYDNVRTARLRGGRPDLTRSTNVGTATEDLDSRLDAPLGSACETTVIEKIPCFILQSIAGSLTARIPNGDAGISSR